MPCTQHRQLAAFPKSRIQKEWFRYFNNNKDFRNSGTVHLFSLMALYSYACFRSNSRVIDDRRCYEAPGQWTCKLSALPRILRARSKAHALDLMNYFREAGFIDYEMLDEQSGLLQYTIPKWKDHCTHLEYNYYSYKGSGFFFFPLPVGRELLRAARKTSGKVVFSELDAIMDLWVHTVLNDPGVLGSAFAPVVYFSDMRGRPLLSYRYLARRWGWSSSRVGRFILKIEEAGIISRVSYSSSFGSVIVPCRFREMIYGEDGTELRLRLIGEILGLSKAVMPEKVPDDVQLSVETRVPNRSGVFPAKKALKIQAFSGIRQSFFARETPLIFYSGLDWGEPEVTVHVDRGPPGERPETEGAD